MKLLLIEDNQGLVRRILRHIPAPYRVDAVATGTEALAKIGQTEYHIIALDLGLPDMTGLEVCRGIRRAGVVCPILVLTGEDDMNVRLDLFNAGADDYLTKPFDSRELTARVTALGRRQPLAVVRETITVGELRVDVHSRSVTRAGVPILLRRKEFDILLYLVRNQGRVVTRDMIAENVWTSNGGSWINTIDVHIKNLRDKVDRPFGVPLIRTQYGIGYRVEAPEGVTMEGRTP